MYVHRIHGTCIWLVKPTSLTIFMVGDRRVLIFSTLIANGVYMIRNVSDHRYDIIVKGQAKYTPSLFYLPSRCGEARSQLPNSRDPSSSISLASTTSTSCVSLTTEDSASNTTVVNIANNSKKRPLSSPDASSAKQPKPHLAVESPPDEMSLYKSTRTILSKYVRATQYSNYFKIQVQSAILRTTLSPNNLTLN